MVKYYADKYILKFLFVINTIVLFCIMILIVYKKYYKNTENVLPESIPVTTVFALVIVYALFAFVMLPIWYRSLNYSVSPEEIIIQSGVISKAVTYLKTSEIQYVTTVKCRILPKVNLNFLLMDVYGKKLIMKFLSTENLEEIVKSIRFESEGKKKLC